MRTSNPALGKATFQTNWFAVTEERMTLEGTANKSAFFLLVVAAAAFASWIYLAGLPAFPAIGGVITGLGFCGLAVAYITIRNKEKAAYWGTLYAALEGVAIGVISFIYELNYPGIVFQAVLLTFGTLLALLVIYRLGIIQVTENLKLGVFAATGGIALLYLAGFFLRIIGFNIGFLHDASIGGILFNLLVVAIAAFNLVLDFDFIEKGVEVGAPKYMEWYAAFGLTVTLIWLYIEILRLLGRSRRRSRR
ncbi:MAG: Bax inhibitor-1/YccA family protein [Anaerolineae bacterium]|nr:Bax inhibitor-1/YccA family protein [Anaerolineae bacterium]